MSTRQAAPGAAGGIAGPYVFSLANYVAFLHPTYLRYAGDTLWLSLVATLISVTAAYPIACWLAFARKTPWRRIVLASLVITLYASAVVKVYGVSIAFGPNGMRDWLAAMWSVGPSNRLVTSTIVVIGLVNFLAPIAILMMVAPLQQINPSLGAAAQSLGANRITAHLTVIIPICRGGIAQVSMLVYAAAVSAFVIPLILGRGQINFLSNLVYARFSEVADFPGGAALSIILLVVTLAATLGLGRLIGGGHRPWQRAAA
jgi:ABC-type spermidine/putrescine transport system permease subunit I